MTVPYDVIADVLAILNRISAGEMPTVACDMIGLSYNTFCTYTTRYPQLAELRKEAEDRLYDRMAEALPRIFDDEQFGRHDPKEAGVVSSNIKWLLERKRKDAFGAHSVVEHKITADREVLDALQRAKARAQGEDFGAIVSVAENVIDLTLLETGSFGREAPASPLTNFGPSIDKNVIEDPYDLSSLK
jgi:hypothetical protein